MKPIFIKSTLISFFLIFASSTLSAQERGLDERINDAFTPIANWWEGLILHNFPGTEIPTIIFSTHGIYRGHKMTDVNKTKIKGEEKCSSY